MQRFPEGTVVNIEDFRRSNWKAAINSSGEGGYHGRWKALSDAARAAIVNGDSSQGKVLWLLADACSMMLKPGSGNEPFKPMMIMQGKRSALPEDFQPQDVDLLAEVAEEVDDSWLQARLADLAWLLKQPRSPKHALLAIDSYRMITLDRETWIRDGQECWARAINLTRTLRTAAGERIGEIEEALINAFEAAKLEDGYYVLQLSELLLSIGLGKAKSAAIATRLQGTAQAFESKGELHIAREFFAGAVKWYQRAGERERATQMTVCVAEGWVKEAEAQGSQMMASGFYESAIQVYRTIPRSERSPHKVDERVAELYARLSDAGERALAEMGVFTSPSIDISKTVESARNAVRGKSVTEALLSLANIHGGFHVEELRRESDQMLKAHPLQALFSATHISRDGRVIAKRQGGFEADDYQATVWAEMIRRYSMDISLVVQGMIWPALEVVAMEHRIKECDFISLARRSTIVPFGRERLWGKALFAGYESDFTTALHLLVPQIEHMLRTRLKLAGVKTRNLDKEGLENEYGLSTLMELPEASQIFGEDLAFEVKVLFCEPTGPNLRNEIAHGLLDDDHCESFAAIYAWWLGLKLVFNTYWNSVKEGKTVATGEHAENETEDRE